MKLTRKTKNYYDIIYNGDIFYNLIISKLNFFTENFKIIFNYSYLSNIKKSGDKITLTFTWVTVYTNSIFLKQTIKEIEKLKNFNKFIVLIKDNKVLSLDGYTAIEHISEKMFKKEYPEYISLL